MRSEESERPATKISPLQIAGGIFTFIGTLIGLLATDKPELVIGGLIVGAAALLVFAGIVWRKKDKKAAGWLTAGAAAVAVSAVLYANFIPSVAPEEGKQLGTETQTPSVAKPPQQSPSPLRSTGPVSQGTFEIGIGQAIDIDTPNTTAEYTESLKRHHDIHIDERTQPTDKDGPLLAFTGDAMKGREICNRLYTSGAARQLLPTLPFTSYCMRTSEGKLATVTVTSIGTLRVYDKTGVAQMTYRIWE